MSTPRGLRLNNPGNIFHGSSRWKGMAKEQPDPEIVKFKTAADGLRAMARTLVNYHRRHGIKTIRGVIERYAPAKGQGHTNDTEAYIASVGKRTGLPTDRPLRLDYWLTLFRLMPAMIRHEQGQQPFKMDEILNAIRAAGIPVEIQTAADLMPRGPL